MSRKQAEELGMEALKHPVCEECGADLAGMGITSLDGTRVIRWSVMDCDCVAAQGNRQEAAERKFDRMMANAEHENADKTERKRQRTIATGVPALFRSAVVDNKDAARYVREFGPEEHKGLYIVGSFGSGKSYLAAAVALAVSGKGHNVAYSTTMALLNEFKATYNGDGDECDVISRYSKAELLVLDDMGKEPPKEWALSMLWELVNERYESMLPTIITTQYDDTELVKRLSSHGDKKTAQALASRLFGTCYRIELLGGDRR